MIHYTYLNNIEQNYRTLSGNIPPPEIWYWFNSPHPTKRYDIMDNNDKIAYLICGYCPYELPADIHEAIRKYSWYQDGEYSLRCIETTHCLAQYIDQYINSEENKCPYSNNEDFDLLEHVYIRGGAIRDCYLLREINDIDLAIDSHDLSKRFMDHLIKYHYTVEQQQNCKCIYWRRYMKKFEKECLTDEIFRWQQCQYDRHEVNKILTLQRYFVMSEFLLNARFIIDILQKNPNIEVASRYHGEHWVIKYEGKTKWYDDNYVEFDLADGMDNSRGIKDTFAEYGKFYELSKDQIAATIANMKHFDDSILWLKEWVSVQKWISVPLYPFPANNRWYDLTINGGHVNLRSVLSNSSGMNAGCIDYN